MSGLFDWIVCAANVDAAEILDSMVQAEHVLYRPAFADGGNGDALGDTRCKQSLIT